MTKNVHEILTEVDKAKSVKARAEILQKNDSLVLRTILRGAFDPAIQFNLPEGDPPYKKDDGPEGGSPTHISSQIRYFRYFVKGGEGDTYPSVRREAMFTKMLESVHPTEAEVLIGMKDKNLKYRGLTLNLVETAFPGMITIEKEAKDINEQKAATKEVS